MVVEKLEKDLLQRDLVDHDWWFQAGRLVHLISDLAQPLHTDRNPVEKKVHGPYEAWLNQMLIKGKSAEYFQKLSNQSEPTRYTEASKMKPMPWIALAAKSHQDYHFLLKNFRSRITRPKVRLRTQLWLELAVRQSAKRLDRILRLRQIGSQVSDSVKPWQVNDAVWLIAFLLAIGVTIESSSTIRSS